MGAIFNGASSYGARRHYIWTLKCVGWTNSEILGSADHVQVLSGSAWFYWVPRGSVTLASLLSNVLELC